MFGKLNEIVHNKELLKLTVLHSLLKQLITDVLNRLFFFNCQLVNHDYDCATFLHYEISYEKFCRRI